MTCSAAASAEADCTAVEGTALFCWESGAAGRAAEVRSALGAGGSELAVFCFRGQELKTSAKPTAPTTATATRAQAT